MSYHLWYIVRYLCLVWFGFYLLFNCVAIARLDSLEADIQLFYRDIV